LARIRLATRTRATVLRRPDRVGLVQATLAFALLPGIYLVALKQGTAENEIRALTFFSPVLTITG
jgi:Ca2+-transporting ATPase